MFIVFMKQDRLFFWVRSVPDKVDERVVMEDRTGVFKGVGERHHTFTNDLQGD